MASLPPQRRQSSQTTQPSISSTAEDSQSIPNRRSSQHSTSSSSQTNQAISPPQTSTHNIPEEDLPKCWICFQDPSEDDPQTASPWRNPCPCALTAHEACLLDWIADMEAPTSSNRAGNKKGKILCPQCKNEVKLERPRSLAVDAYRRVESLSSWAMIPGLAIGSSLSLGLVMQWHGIFAIQQVFGSDDARELLRPLEEEIFHPRKFPESLAVFARNWRLLIGPTVIPGALILSRTTLGDGILPVLPLIFFGSKPDRLLTGSGKGPWPPSAALSFALLPYIRGAYNFYYEKVWAERERQWIKQIKPRANAETLAENAPQQGGDDEIVGFHIEDEEGQIEIDFRIVDEWEENERVHAEHEAEQAQVQEAHPLNAPPLDQGVGVGEDDAAPAPNIPDNRGQQQQGEGQQPAPAQRREANLLLTAISLVRTSFGALLFPSVAASMGQLLRLALPKAWVTTQGSKPTGILQTRWGRSLVGGCLFVAFRDVLRLYVRWKMATMHQRRRILDYKGPRPGGVRAS